MDRKLRSELNAIARDRTSGAAELALRAVTALQGWLRREENPEPEQMLEIASVLLRSQHAMAPLLRLANELALAADARHPERTLRRKLRELEGILRTGAKRIAGYFYRALPKKRDNLLLTYSYSSTVVGALVRARRRIRAVFCSEGRPGMEGRKTATELARAGIQVLFSSDAALLHRPGVCRPVVVGADAITPLGFWNKVGTDVLVESAEEERLPTFVLADTTKFWPEPAFHVHAALAGAPIWPKAPKNILSFCGLFCLAPFTRRMQFITERGPMTPGQVQRELRRIKVSPRLDELAK